MEENNAQKPSLNLDLIAFCKICLKQWKWFAICGFVMACYGAYSYLNNKPQVQVDASVMLPTQTGSNSMVLNLAKNFSIGDMFGGSSSTENESMVLGSYDQFLRTTQKLGLNVGYAYKGRLTWKSAYLNSPIKVQFAQSIADTLSIGHTFEIEKNSEGTFNFKIELFKEKFEFKNQTMPCTLKLPTGEFTFSTTEFYNPKKQSDFKVFVSSYNDAAQSLAKTVDISIPSKKADFLSLSYLTQEPEFGVILLETIIESYNDIATSQKNELNNRTLRMVDGRLKTLSKELAESEIEIEAFKKQNNLTDIESDAKLMLQQAGTYENSLLVAQTENAIIKNTRDFINNPDNQYQLIPSLSSSVQLGGKSSTTGSSANDAIGEYNRLVLERMKMMTSAKNNNATLKLLDEQLDALLANIKESVERAYVNSNIALNDVKSKAGSTKSGISSYPTLEREFIAMKRNQLVQEQLYLFLLQQREEALISLSSASQNCVTIDQPHVISTLVGLGLMKRTFIYGFIGLLLAAALVFILKYIKVGFFNVNSLKKILSVPVLGEISGKPDDMKVNVTPTTAQTRADVIFTLEQIKGKRILVSAPASCQGSGYVALTLAASLAEIGKKVILINADFRSDDLANNGQSLADFTEGNASLSSIICPNYMNISGLDGVPAGKSDVPARVLASQRMSELVDTFTARYDYIIIAGAEVDTYSETFALASVVDLTLMTLRTGIASPADLKFVDELAAAGRFPNIAAIATEK